MLCPCCGVPILETRGERGHAVGSTIPPRVRRRGGHRRLGGYVMCGADAESELVALLESKHQQLARFGLVEAGDPLLEATNRKAD